MTRMGVLAAPFDAIAGDYDETFSRTRVGRWLRRQVMETLEPVFAPGQKVLELGCGTGEDCLWLARRGIRVVATDVSGAMLEVARRKCEAAGEAARLEFRKLDLTALADATPRLPHDFDGALCNFGVLNCVPDRTSVAAALAGVVKPGGHVATVVMGPLCPWEMGWHLAHGRPRTAFRRFRSGREAHLGNGSSIPVWYPSPRRLRCEFAPFFDPVKSVGIGAMLPPPYLNHLAEHWPRLLKALADRDRRWSGSFPWTWLNDHYLIVFRRR